MSGYSWTNDAMRIQIRTKDFRLNLPVPAALVGVVVRILPDRLFESLRAKTPEPYDILITKDVVQPLLRECLNTIKGNKGLEIVHVEAADGTFVSVKL